MKRIIIIVVGLVVLLSAVSAFSYWEDFENPEYFAGMAFGQTCGSLFGVEISGKMGHIGVGMGIGGAYGNDPTEDRSVFFGYAITGKFHFNMDSYDGVWLGLGYGTSPIINDLDDRGGLFGLVGFTYEADSGVTIQPSFGFHSLGFNPTISVVIGGIFK